MIDAAIITMDRETARRLASHFVTRGHWFSVVVRKGRFVVAISTAHDLTSLARKFPHDLATVDEAADAIVPH